MIEKKTTTTTTVKEQYLSPPHIGPLSVSGTRVKSGCVVGFSPVPTWKCCRSPAVAPHPSFPPPSPAWHFLLPLLLPWPRPPTVPRPCRRNPRLCSNIYSCSPSPIDDDLLRFIPILRMDRDLPPRNSSIPATGESNDGWKWLFGHRLLLQAHHPRVGRGCLRTTTRSTWVMQTGVQPKPAESDHPRLPFRFDRERCDKNHS